MINFSKIIKLDDQRELKVHRNDDLGFVAEILHVERNEHGGSISTPLGHIFTFYDPELFIDGTLPHWQGYAYIQESSLTNELGNLIGEAILKHTACMEPFSLSGRSYLPYKHETKDVSDTKTFLFSKGEIWMND